MITAASRTKRKPFAVERVFADSSSPAAGGEICCGRRSLVRTRDLGSLGNEQVTGFDQFQMRHGFLPDDVSLVWGCAGPAVASRFR